MITFLRELCDLCDFGAESPVRAGVATAVFLGIGFFLCVLHVTVGGFFDALRQRIERGTR